MDSGQHNWIVNASIVCQVQRPTIMVFVMLSRYAKFSKDGLAGLAQSLMRMQACIVTTQTILAQLQTGLIGHAQSLMRMHAL